jgi:uncharacterized membrane protein
MKTKNDIFKAALSSAICLLPVILSAVLYNDLPEKIAIHWNIAGDPDRYAPKAVAAFGLPVAFMLLNIFINLRLAGDSQRAGASRASRKIALWAVPVVSLVIVPVTLFIAAGAVIPLTVVVPLFAGVVLILYGNYLPKNRQNSVIGYRTPWARRDADNWNKTHRLAGYLWMIGGAVIIAQAFALFKNTLWIVISAFIWAILAVIPVFYSYALHKASTDQRITADPRP